MVAALDSVNARLYVDELCLLHSKPWVEAGTLGLRGVQPLRTFHSLVFAHC